MARRKNRNNAKTSSETTGNKANVKDVASTPEEVQVNENKSGEATNNTTQQGDTSTVENTDKIPQNGVDKIETLQVTDDPIALEADANRTKEEIQFADESNPNQKGRNASAPEEYDQDGNLRTDGYSYGVAADDTRSLSEDAVKANAGEAPEKADPKTKFHNVRVFTADSQQVDTVNTEDTNVELTPEEVTKLEDDLSRPDDGVSARVVSSTGSYYRIKFFRNNKPFITYKAKTNKLDKKEVKAFVTAALKVEQ